MVGDAITEPPRGIAVYFWLTRCGDSVVGSTLSGGLDAPAIIAGDACRGCACVLGILVEEAS
jgi:hypothetical protein